MHYNDSRKRVWHLLPTVMEGAAYSWRCWIVIKLTILNMNGYLQIVNQCSGAVNAVCPDGKWRDINKSYAAQKVLWDQFRENHGSLALKLDFQKPEDYVRIVYHHISEI